MCVCVSAWGCVYMSADVPEIVSDPPGAGIAGGCEPRDRSVNSGPLEEGHMLLITEPLLQPLKYKMFKN